jgi:hypothetical protein
MPAAGKYLPVFFVSFMARENFMMSQYPRNQIVINTIFDIVFMAYPLHLLPSHVLWEGRWIRVYFLLQPG